MQNPVEVWRTYRGKQAQQRFIDINTGARCALGVLAGEAARTNDEARLWIDANGRDVYGFSEGSSSREFPLGYCPHCWQRVWDGQSLVMHLNDSHHLTFAEIAAFAETNPDQFFTPEAMKEFGYA